MAHAIYPGSFDPLTLGHLDVIQRVSPLFETVSVIVSSNPSKTVMFTPEERKSLVEASVQDLGLKNVQCVIHQGLTVEIAKILKAQVIIRGLRAVTDYDLELAMAHLNRTLQPQIETMICLASPEHHFISSRMVKELYHFGANVDKLVPKAVIKALASKKKD